MAYRAGLVGDQIGGQYNSVVSLITQNRIKNSTVINDATTAFLTLNAEPGEGPSHTDLEFCWITDIIGAREPLPDTTREALNRFAVLLSGEEVDDVRQAILELGEDTRYLTMILFKLMNGQKTEYMTSLQIFSSIMRLQSSNFDRDMTAVLMTLGWKVRRVSLITFLDENPILWANNPLDISRYIDMRPAHYVYAVSLYMTLIGKALNSNNYTGWTTQRARSYSSPLGLRDTDPVLLALRPSLPVAINLNGEVKMFWNIRRLFFSYAWALSKGTELISRGMKVCVNLLRFSEMTNMSMIMVWIVSLNDILLGWGELSKFVPYLCAAYAKYKQLGAVGPWAKLILPPDEVQEFAADKLKTLFAVARAISAKYGSATASQIEGVSKSSEIERIVDQALRIVSFAGGARTVDSMAIRQLRLNGYDNQVLIRELDTGAEMLPHREIEERNPQLEERIG